MSATIPAQSNRASTDSEELTTGRARWLAKSYIEKFSADHCICSWCYDRRRVAYPEYDHARINAKDMAKNSCAIHHFTSEFERDDEGTLQVISATSGPDHRAYREVVPPKTDKYGAWIEPPRPKTICPGCANIDFERNAHRSERTLTAAVRNLADRIEEVENHQYGPDRGDGTNARPVYVPSALKMLHALYEHSETHGKDMWVLERSLTKGLKHGSRVGSSQTDD